MNDSHLNTNIKAIIPNNPIINPSSPTFSSPLPHKADDTNIMGLLTLPRSLTQANYAPEQCSLQQLVQKSHRGRACQHHCKSRNRDTYR